MLQPQVDTEIEPLATRVREVMEPRPQFLGTGQTVEHAARRMIVHGISSLPVCRSDGRVVGVVGPREIMRAVADGRAPELCPIDDVMVADFPACRTDDTIEDVRARMVRGGLDEMLVVAPGGTLAGVVRRGRAWSVVSAPSGARSRLA